MLFFVNLVDALAWPAVVVYAIYIFRHPAIALIDRIRSASAFGVKIDTPDQLQNTEENPDNADSIKDLMAIPETEMIQEFEGNIKQVLHERGHEVTTPLDNMLLRNFVDTSIRFNYELIYKHIFGSQIRALKSLNISGPSTAEQLEAEYEVIKNQTPALVAWSLSKYLHYLFGSTLIRLDGDIYNITVKGQDFLIWLTRSGYSERPNEL